MKLNEKGKISVFLKSLAYMYFWPKFTKQKTCEKAKIIYFFLFFSPFMLLYKTFKINNTYI